MWSSMFEIIIVIRDNTGNKNIASGSTRIHLFYQGEPWKTCQLLGKNCEARSSPGVHKRVRHEPILINPCECSSWQQAWPWTPVCVWKPSCVHVLNPCPGQGHWRSPSPLLFHPFHRGRSSQKRAQRERHGPGSVTLLPCTVRAAGCFCLAGVNAAPAALTNPHAFPSVQGVHLFVSHHSWVHRQLPDQHHENWGWFLCYQWD